MKKTLLLLLLVSSVKMFSQTKEKKDDIPEICPIVFANTLSVNSEISDWKFSCDCSIKELHLTIYNRWGEQLFKTDSLPASHIPEWNWKKLASGTYYFILNCVVDNKDKPLEKKQEGYVTLVTEN